MGCIVNADIFHIYCVVENGRKLTGPCKVGVATRLNTRLSSLQCGNWRKLELAWVWKIKNRDFALEIESRILARLRPCIFGTLGSRKRLKSEWVDATPAEAYRAGHDLLEVLLEVIS